MVKYYTDDPIFAYDSVEHTDLPAAARVYVYALNKNFKWLLQNKREALEEWDKYYFDPDEWKIDSEVPWQFRMWTGPEYNELNHDEILRSLPEDAQEIKEYNQIMNDIVKFNTQDLSEMEKLVAKEEHPGRANSIANQAAQEAGNRKREAEILAEPTVSTATLLSRLEARVSKLEAKMF